MPRNACLEPVPLYRLQPGPAWVQLNSATTTLLYGIMHRRELIDLFIAP